MYVENRWDLSNKRQRRIAWLNSMFFEDHNFTNFIRFNFHEIAPGVYRSSQPRMKKFKVLKENFGVQTIINLKSEKRKSAYFLFEEEKCKELGLKLINVNINSREMPTTDQLLEYERILKYEMKKPVLIHCKAGADRTGLFCTLYQYFIEKKEIKDTDQLKFLPYGHVKYSNAGRIDYFFEQFSKYKEQHPEIDLITWSKNIADINKMRKDFKANSILDFFNDKILRRE